LSERVRKKELLGFLEIGRNVYDGKSMLATLAANTDKFTRDDQEKGLNAIPSFSFLPDGLVLRYQSNSPMYGSFYHWAQQTLTAAILLERSAQNHVDLIKVQETVTPPQVLNKGLTRKSPRTGAIEDGKDVNFLASFFAPFILIMMMFMIVMVGATPLMQG